MDAALGAFVWEPSVEAGYRAVRLALSDLRGAQTLLPALPLALSAADLAPTITLTLGRQGSGRVVRWLAHDPADEPLAVRLLWREAAGSPALLAAGQAEVGELLLPAALTVASGEVCALADNGLTATLVCEPVMPPSRWDVQPLQPCFGQELLAMTSVSWRVALPQGAPQIETQRLWWSRDGRQTWTPLADLTPAVRRYVWDTTALPR